MAKKKKSEVELVEQLLPSDEELTPVQLFVKDVYSFDGKVESLALDKYSLGPWSISKLKLLRKCPFQFYLKYVLKVKLPSDVGGRSDTTSADVGSAAHLILEHIMTGKSTQEAYALARVEYNTSKLSDELWAERVETLEHSINSFRDRMEALGRRNKVRRVFTELRIGVTKDWKPCSFFAKDVYMRGVIDLIIQLDNGVILIIDHKTGGGEGSLRPYEDQLNSYKVLFNFGIEKVPAAQSYIHFIQAGEVKSSYLTESVDIEGKLKDMLEFDIETAIESVEELGFFKHIRGTHCKWCDYDSMCKPGDFKQLELGTKKFFKIQAVS